MSKKNFLTNFTQLIGPLPRALILIIALTIFLASLFFIGSSQKANASATLSPIEELGKRLFFDKNLSIPAGQECAACHGQSVGFTGPDEKLNKKAGIYEGAVKGRFGNRKPPSSAYAGDSPILRRNEEGDFVGGMFWDGRATGERLGDPLAEQALGPFLNPLEQNMADTKAVVETVLKSEYAKLFEQVWGPGSLNAEKDGTTAYDRIGRAIAAYERSAEVNPFNSKFDDFWRTAKSAGLKVEDIREENKKDFSNKGLTPRELDGLVLFNTKGKCSACHVLTSVGGHPPLFTDFTYDNLGLPQNPENPFYNQPARFNPEGKKWVDKGLGGFLETEEKYKAFAGENYGKHKVPTLRNVDKQSWSGFIKAFMHNGCFKTLKDVVSFYNTRDKFPAKWGPAEVARNINRDEMGDLGLSDDEENAIVDFMKILTDRN